MQPPSRWRARSLVIAATVVGVAVSITAGIAASQHARDTARDWLEDQAVVVAAETQDVVERAIDGLGAAAAFMEATPAVDQETFSAFVSRLDPTLSLIGIGYLAIVPDGQLDAFTAAMQEDVPGFALTEISPAGEVMAASRDRGTYYPVQFFQPGAILNQALAGEAGSPLTLSVGFDGGSQPPWRPGLALAVDNDTATVSDVVEVAFGDTSIGNAFIAAVPVHDGSQGVVGLVAAPLVDTLLQPDLDAAIATDVVWRVDHSGTEAAVDGESHMITVDLPGASWNLIVEPTAEARRRLAGRPAWVAVVFGLVVTGLAVVLIELFLTRTRSRRRLEELSRLSAEKDRFLATISHEIRTPLSAVMAVANELRDRPDDFSAKESHELLELMVEQSDEVSALVEDLLVVGRVDVGTIQISPVPMSLIGEAQRTVASTGITARVTGSDVTALADPGRVRQIMRNLLTNARRYGGPTIGVRVYQDGGFAVAEVVDDGRPIPPDERHRIFDAYTTSRGTRPSVGSVGLGLFISATLARLLGGDLSYHHDGTHSVFRLRLPTAPALAAATGGPSPAPPQVVHPSSEASGF